MKLDIGNLHFRDHYGKSYMLQRWAYTTKREGLKALENAKEFSAKYRRHEANILLKDKVKSGEGKDKIVYVVGTRGTR